MNILNGFIINKNGLRVEIHIIIKIKLKITCSEYLPEIIKVKKIMLFSGFLQIPIIFHGKYFLNVSEYL